MIWLLEHPPLYTAGVSAKPGDLIDADRFPVFQSGRGGQFTYHGPGQRVAYVMLDLKRRREDVRAFVTALEDWIIGALDQFNVKGEVREGRVGVALGEHGRRRGRGVGMHARVVSFQRLFGIIAAGRGVAPVHPQAAARRHRDAQRKRAERALRRAGAHVPLAVPGENTPVTRVATNSSTATMAMARTALLPATEAAGVSSASPCRTACA